MEQQIVDINRMVRFVTDHAGPVPAIVTAMEGSEVVSLFVMEKFKNYHIQGVGHDENKTPRTWHWPPRK